MLFLLNAAKTASDALSVDALKIEKLIDKLIDLSITAGKHILMAVVIFVVGRFIVTLLNRLLARMLERRKVDPTIQTFLKSLVNILLMLLLVVSVIGALGVNTTSLPPCWPPPVWPSAWPYRGSCRTWLAGSSSCCSALTRWATGLRRRACRAR